MTILLIILYPFAIQYTRGGWWRLMILVTVLASIIDVIVNYTELALLTWDFPRKGEYMFSMRLERLIHNDDWRGSLARAIAVPLDYFDPSGRHIAR